MSSWSSVPSSPRSRCVWRDRRRWPRRPRRSCPPRHGDSRCAVTSAPQMDHPENRSRSRRPVLRPLGAARWNGKPGRRETRGTQREPMTAPHPQRAQSGPSFLGTTEEAHLGEVPLAKSLPEVTGPSHRSLIYCSLHCLDSPTRPFVGTCPGRDYTADTFLQVVCSLFPADRDPPIPRSAHICPRRHMSSQISPDHVGLALDFCSRTRSTSSSPTSIWSTWMAWR